MSKSIKIIFIALSILVFTLLIKIFYFDTNMGFRTEILELNYSAFPKCVDAIIFVIFWPLIVYALLEQFLEFITTKISNFKSIKAKKIS